MTKPWYDTRTGIERRLEGGLNGVHEIARARREAGYDRNERLAEWCLLGVFWLDTCGNFSIITEGAPKDGYHYWRKEGIYEVPPLMTREQTQEFSVRWSSTGAGLPPSDECCDRCGRGWGLENVRDYIRRQDKPPRHQSCHCLAIIEDEQKEITEIVRRSEVPHTGLTMIPNQYHPNPDPTYYGPWFMIETAAGRVKIGWRKRVISISWDQTGLVARGEDVVESPDVTHDETMVHAYGADKAVEALRKLWAKGSGEPEKASGGLQ